MSDIQVFNFKAFPVRTVIKDGEPWFVAADVCNVLGIGKYRDAVSRLSDSQRGSVVVDTLGGKQEMSAVNEAGVYKLAFTSRKPEAEAFTDWVASDVLPSIRKHGMYATLATVEEMLADPDTMIAALQKLKAEQEARKLAERRLALAQPKVEGYDQLMAADDCVSIGKLAKALGTGQNRLFAFLRG
jgi:anti-repressor protein